MMLRSIALILMLCAGVGVQAAEKVPADFVPTPLLIGSDFARARIIIYHSLTCGLCGALEKELSDKRDFLIKHGIAVEFRLISWDEKTLLKNSWVLAQTLQGKEKDPLKLFYTARYAAITERHLRAPKHIAHAVSKWLEWFNDRAKADGVLTVNDKGEEVFVTPSAFVTLNGVVLSPIEKGVNLLEFILQPYYEIGWLKWGRE